MAISSSSKTVQDMKVTLQQAIREMNEVQVNLRSTVHSAASWTDAQGQQYRELMKRVVRLTETPKSTLNEAVPKLDRMIRALDSYEKVRF